MKQELSENEMGVLRELISDGRGSRTEIGKKVGISSQGVAKIQKKLEDSGIISGYSAVVDYDLLGVEVFALAFFKFKSGNWSRLETEDIKRRVNGPHLINLYRFKEGDITHMVIYGFRNLKEADNYFHYLQTERGHISEIRKLYIISSASVMKDSDKELLIKALEEYDHEKMARPIDPGE